MIVKGPELLPIPTGLGTAEVFGQGSRDFRALRSVLFLVDEWLKQS